jgi:hypothetical protein
MGGWQPCSRARHGARRQCRWNRSSTLSAIAVSVRGSREGTGGRRHPIMSASTTWSVATAAGDPRMNSGRSDRAAGAVRSRVWSMRGDLSRGSVVPANGADDWRVARLAHAARARSERSATSADRSGSSQARDAAEGGPVGARDSGCVCGSLWPAAIYSGSSFQVWVLSGPEGRRHRQWLRSASQRCCWP